MSMETRLRYLATARYIAFFFIVRAVVAWQAYSEAGTNYAEARVALDNLVRSREGLASDFRDTFGVPLGADMKTILPPSLALVSQSEKAKTAWQSLVAAWNDSNQLAARKEQLDEWDERISWGLFQGTDPAPIAKARVSLESAAANVDAQRGNVALLKELLELEQLRELKRNQS